MVNNSVYKQSGIETYREQVTVFDRNHNLDSDYFLLLYWKGGILTSIYFISKLLM